MSSFRPRRSRAALPTGVALASVLVLPAAASATVTATSVEAPAPDAVLTRQADLFVANPSFTTAFRGVAPGATTGDLVDLVCTWSTPAGPQAVVLAQDVAVAAGGRFAVDALQPTTLCRVRAVPADTTAADADSPAFAGPRVRGGELAAGSTSQGPQVVASSFRVGSGQGRGAVRVVGPLTHADVPGAWGAGIERAGGLLEVATADGTALRPVFGPSAALSALPGAGTGPADAQLVVDGAAAAPAEGPTYARRLTVQRDPATGDLDAGEEIPVRLVGAPGAPGADAGVVVERRFRQDHDGRLVTVRDHVRSTDGAAHRVELRYGDSAAAPASGQGAPAFRVPWTTGDAYVVPADGTTFGAAPTGASPTVHVRVAGDSVAPPRPGSGRRAAADGAFGAVAFDTAPADGRFVSARELATRVVLDVPAGGEAVAARRYALGSTAAEVDELLRATAPVVGNDPPAGGLRPPVDVPPTPPIGRYVPPRVVSPLPRVSAAARKLLLTRKQAARLRGGKAVVLSVSGVPAGRYGVSIQRSSRRGAVIARGVQTLRTKGRLALRVRLTAAGRRSFATAAGQRRRVVRSVVTVSWKPAGQPTRTRTTAVRARFR